MLGHGKKKETRKSEGTKRPTKKLTTCWKSIQKETRKLHTKHQILEVHYSVVRKKRRKLHTKLTTCWKSTYSVVRELAFINPICST
jgi:hypothetical protein